MTHGVKISHSSGLVHRPAIRLTPLSKVYSGMLLISVSRGILWSAGMTPMDGVLQGLVMGGYGKNVLVGVGAKSW